MKQVLCSIQNCGTWLEKYSGLYLNFTCTVGEVGVYRLKRKKTKTSPLRKPAKLIQLLDVSIPEESEVIQQIFVQKQETFNRLQHGDTIHMTARIQGSTLRSINVTRKKDEYNMWVKPDCTRSVLLPIDQCTVGWKTDFSLQNLLGHQCV
jgi:hypothetical protein